MKNEPKICLACGKEFIPKYGNEKYCSKECVKKVKSGYARLTYWRKKNGFQRPLRTCPICGNSFEPIGNRKYCSYECSKVADKEYGRHYRSEHLTAMRQSNYDYRQRNREECNRRERERMQRVKLGVEPEKPKKSKQELMYECRKEHNMCFDCPTENGECLYD